MREYWIPAIRSQELACDGAPMRLLLLGEKLIAFRDTAGRVGVFAHACPHRCASLFFGRNEEDGIRCVYHGWKFDVSGRCVEMPNVSQGDRLRDNVRAKAYRVTEQNGILWVYMGTRQLPPPLPLLAAAARPEHELTIQFVQRECNWLQAAEGDIDTSHFGFLHAGSVRADELPSDHQSRFALIDRAPEYHISDTECGTMYAAFRSAGDGETYWRFAHFLFPFWTMPPDGDFHRRLLARAWVPMDDTHTMAVIIRWKRNAPALREKKDGTRIPGTTPDMHLLPNSADWYGRWRLRENATNDYCIDRDAQQTASFTGIDGVFLQDQAITESMGPIVDHSSEHLSPSDRMIAHTRRRILNAADAFVESQKVPPGLESPGGYGKARCGDCIAPAAMTWEQVYAQAIERANKHDEACQVDMQATNEKLSAT